MGFVLATTLIACTRIFHPNGRRNLLCTHCVPHCLNVGLLLVTSLYPPQSGSFIESQPDLELIRVQAQNLEHLDEERLRLHSSVTTALAHFTERLVVAQAVAPPSEILGQVVDEYSTIDSLVTRVLGVDPRPCYDANLLHPSVLTTPSHRAEVVMSPAGNTVCLLSLCCI